MHIVLSALNKDEKEKVELIIFTVVKIAYLSKFI